MTSFEEVIRRIVREEVRAALKELQCPQVIEPPEHLFSSAEAAQLLGVAPATMRDWRTDRKGPPAVKLGGAVRYRREDLDQWIAVQRG